MTFIYFFSHLDHVNDVNGSHSGSSGRSTPQQFYEPHPNKMFVGGLSWQTDNDKMKEYFATFGDVKDVLILKDPISHVSFSTQYIYRTKRSHLTNVQGSLFSFSDLLT